MNRDQATASSDQHPGLPFVPDWPQLNADMEKGSPAFFEADLGKTDPLAYNIAKNLTELLNSHGTKIAHHGRGHTWINWRH